MKGKIEITTMARFIAIVLTGNMIILSLLFSGMTSCGQRIQNKDYLVLFEDTLTNKNGYKNIKGDIVIPTGKYVRCFTDTFRIYAFVVKSGGFVAIDRQENVLYKVFSSDNGPDEASEGLFRIMENNKIGFADSLTGKVIIKPKFNCAYPFEKGVAMVSIDCKSQSDGEHSTWVSDNWYYIDKTGRKVEKPKSIRE